MLFMHFWLDYTTMTTLAWLVRKRPLALISSMPVCIALLFPNGEAVTMADMVY